MWKKDRSWRSRAIDYSCYIGIGLCVVAVAVVLAVTIPDANLASQLWTAFFGACLTSAYIIWTLWKQKEHAVLLSYFAAAVSVHFVTWILVYRVFGLTKAPNAGAAIIVETAIFISLAEAILPARRHRSQGTN